MKKAVTQQALEAGKDEEKEDTESQPMSDELMATTGTAAFYTELRKRLHQHDPVKYPPDMVGRTWNYPWLFIDTVF